MQTVGFDGPLASNRAAKWLKEVAPIAARVTSVLGLVSVAKSGVAVVPMPIALGDAEPELVRLFELVSDLTRSWRILAHPDRRRTPAVAAFFDFIADEIATLRPVLTGLNPLVSRTSGALRRPQASRKARERLSSSGRRI